MPITRMMLSAAHHLPNRAIPQQCAFSKKQPIIWHAACPGVINLINPQAVIMGGGVARSLHLLTNQLRIKLKDYAVDRLANTEIVPTLLGYDAALIGTAALVLEGIASENPSRSVHE